MKFNNLICLFLAATTAVSAQDKTIDERLQDQGNSIKIIRKKPLKAQSDFNQFVYLEMLQGKSITKTCTALIYSAGLIVTPHSCLVG